MEHATCNDARISGAVGTVAVRACASLSGGTGSSANLAARNAGCSCAESEPDFDVVLPAQAVEPRLLRLRQLLEVHALAQLAARLVEVGELRLLPLEHLEHDEAAAQTDGRRRLSRLERHGDAGERRRQLRRAHGREAPARRARAPVRRVLAGERAEVAGLGLCSDALGELALGALLFGPRAGFEHDPGRGEAELASLFEDELAVRAPDVFVGDADPALETHVDELGLEQLAPELVAVGSLAQATV